MDRWRFKCQSFIRTGAVFQNICPVIVATITVTVLACIIIYFLTTIYFLIRIMHNYDISDVRSLNPTPEKTMLCVPQPGWVLLEPSK